MEAIIATAIAAFVPGSIAVWVYLHRNRREDKERERARAVRRDTIREMARQQSFMLSETPLRDTFPGFSQDVMDCLRTLKVSNRNSLKVYESDSHYFTAKELTSLHTIYEDLLLLREDVGNLLDNFNGFSMDYKKNRGNQISATVNSIAGRLLNLIDEIDRVNQSEGK